MNLEFCILHFGKEVPQKYKLKYKRKQVAAVFLNIEQTLPFSSGELLSWFSSLKEPHTKGAAPWVEIL